MPVGVIAKRVSYVEVEVLLRGIKDVSSAKDKRGQ